MTSNSSDGVSVIVAQFNANADINQSIQDLRDAVAKAVAAGMTLEQAQASVTMDAYKEWEFYDAQRPQNVAGMYRAMTAGRR